MRSVCTAWPPPSDATKSRHGSRHLVFFVFFEFMRTNKKRKRTRHTASIFHKEEFYSCHFKEQFIFGRNPNVHAYHQIFSRTYSLLFENRFHTWSHANMRLPVQCHAKRFSTLKASVQFKTFPSLDTGYLPFIWLAPHCNNTASIRIAAYKQPFDEGFEMMPSAKSSVLSALYKGLSKTLSVPLNRCPFWTAGCPALVCLSLVCISVMQHRGHCRQH